MVYWRKIVFDYIERVKKCTDEIIRMDGDSLKALLLTKHNYVFYLLMLPMAGLYCRVAQEYYGISVIDAETDKKINELRNSYKFVCDKFGKIKSKSLEIDNEQTEHFKNHVKIKLLEDYAPSLGIYFDEAGHVVGDTYLISRYFNSADMEEANKNAYIFGKNIAVYIDAIRNKACLNNTIVIPCSEAINKVGYIDINTNRNDGVFCRSQDKAINIIFLNLLGLLGTDKYINQKLLPENDTWRLRNEYIVAHNIRNGLIKIKNHYNANDDSTIDVHELTNIIIMGRELFNSDFRNCMMHYNLVYEGIPRIKEKFFQEDRVFLGLIESIFEGKDYNEYYSKLREYMSVVETYLNSWFDVKYSRIKWDL